MPLAARRRQGERSWAPSEGHSSITNYTAGARLRKLDSCEAGGFLPTKGQRPVPRGRWPQGSLNKESRPSRPEQRGLLASGRCRSFQPTARLDLGPRAIHEFQRRALTQASPARTIGTCRGEGPYVLGQYAGGAVGNLFLLSRRFLGSAQLFLPFRELRRCDRRTPPRVPPRPPATEPCRCGEQD